MLLLWLEAQAQHEPADLVQKGLVSAKGKLVQGQEEHVFLAVTVEQKQWVSAQEKEPLE